jgi:hypothetical protein
MNDYQFFIISLVSLSLIILFPLFNVVPSPSSNPSHHQANPLSGQHSARAQERAETARQSTLTVTFTARKSPGQATSRVRQPAPTARRYLFQSSFHLCPTARASNATKRRHVQARVSLPVRARQVPIGLV